MNRLHSIFSLMFGLILFTGCSNGSRGNEKLSAKEADATFSKPMMGWNSFDAFDCRINEEEFRETVDFMADSLLEYGWEYAVIDYIWWHPSPGDWDNPGKRYGHPNIRYSGDGKPLDPTTIDEFGRLLPAVERFPSSANGAGFKPLADYVHSKGMKFGIHLMRGIHRYAWYYDLPVLGTEITARQIAEPLDTCLWCNHMFGVDSSMAGAQEYYNSLFELYASWEVDFVKVDDMMYPKYHQGEIEMIRKAIDACGRPMVLSLSCGEAPLSMAEHLAANANMWRVSADFWDEWRHLRRNFDLLAEWSPFIGPGSFPDADMLPVGLISREGRPHGPERFSKFTLPEHYTLFSLWMISKSPLMLGADLRELPQWLYEMVTNPEVIAVNQTSTDNKETFRDENTIVWTAADPGNGDRFLAVFNTSDSVNEARIDLHSADLPGKYSVRDLWTRSDAGTTQDVLEITLEPHGAALYRLVKQ